MPIRPLHDRVLVRRIEAETQTKTGLYIPGNAQEKPVEGFVVAVGNGRLLDDGTVRPMAVKPGERIVFKKYSETDLKVEGEQLILLSEEDILAVVD